MPPRRHKDVPEIASFLHRGLDPQIERFFCTTCRFFGYPGELVKLEMYDSASNSDSDGLGAIACTETRFVGRMTAQSFTRDSQAKRKHLKTGRLV
jgi:hypothetical protein